MKDEVAIEQVTLTCLRFFPYLIIPPISHIILSTLQRKEQVTVTCLRFFPYLIIPPISHIILSTLQRKENGPARDSMCPDTV
jgi:hypothetical protein